jgi:hypothetical protein
MSLTPAQLQTLRTYIDSVPAWAALPNTPDNAFFIAQELQKPVTPAFIVWRTTVTQDEIMQNGFDWVRVDNLSVGKGRIWEWLFENQARSINPSKTNVRAGIAECWKGTAADLAVQAAVLGHCKRSANHVEKLFATGAGTDATPATMTIEGGLDWNLVFAARSL